jgi:hypothetical protein
MIFLLLLQQKENGDFERACLAKRCLSNAYATNLCISRQTKILFLDKGSTYV